MKKILIAAAALIFAAGSLSAQDYQKNIFGAKVGLVTSGLQFKSQESSDLKNGARAGVYFAGSYQRLLTSNLPLYLETGLEFSMAGGTQKLNESYDVGGYSVSSSYKEKINLWYMSIPVMINYKFFVGDFTIYPSLGLYYALGLDGKIKSEYTGSADGDTYTDSYEVKKVFTKYDSESGEGGYFTRSDLGIRVGVTGEWNHITLGLHYSNGFLNLANTSEYGAYDNGTKIHNWNFNISVGYNF